jgi:hypothetical protein
MSDPELDDIDRPGEDDFIAQFGRTIAAALPGSPWQALLGVLDPQCFMKQTSLGELAGRCSDSLKHLLLDASKRDMVLGFVQQSLRGLGAYPHPFIFFLARPKYTGSQWPIVLVIIDEHLRMILFTEERKITLAGVISFFYKKSPTKLHFGLSTRLFVKFTMFIPVINLDRLIEEFRANPTCDALTLFLDCAEELRLKPQFLTGLSPYVFNLIMTPNLEFANMFEKMELNKLCSYRIAQSVLTLCAKAHIHGHCGVE